MAYIGKQPLVGNYTVLDSLTATTTDTYALTKNSVAVFPQTPANCIVSLNGVIQAPVDSYTISGSNIVFASALTASDSIDFITVLGDVLNVGTVSDGTIGLAKLSATGTKDATTFLRGDNTFQTIGANTPAFLVTKSASQTVNATTETLITWDSETIDTDNNFASNKFTPTAAGYYLFNVIVGGGQNDDVTLLTLKKNGSTTYYLWDGDVTDAYAVGGSITLYANGSGDYFEVFLYHGGIGTKAVNNVSHWSGFKLIGV